MPIIITDDDARRLLSMQECIEAMRICYRDFADGKAVSLPRVRYTVGPESLLVPFGRRLLPDSFFLRFIRSYFGI